jgi:flagellar motility protein MotE (MotC chaperone)
MQFTAKTRNMIFLVIFETISEKKSASIFSKVAQKKASKTLMRKLANVKTIFLSLSGQI